MRKAINRSVLVVIPRQPYYDWGGEAFVEDPAGPFEECSAYLLDDDWSIQELRYFLETNFDEIFQDLLYGMCPDPEAWPENRTWEQFNEWFEWHYSSMVWDLLPDRRIRREVF
jgi:hypothetical protein